MILWFCFVLFLSAIALTFHLLRSLSIVESVRVSSLSVPESAPLAGSRSVFVSLVQLNVLHGVAQAELVHSQAAHHRGINLNDRQIIDQLLSISQMSIIRSLNTQTKKKSN